MSVESLMKKVNERYMNFSIKDETIFHVVELCDLYNPPKPENTRAHGAHGRPASEIDAEREERERYLDIVDYLDLMTDRERQELMCLMDFGRNLDYIGFTGDVVETFIDQVDTNHFSHIKGHNGAQYLAGKVPLGRWLRLAMKQVKAGTEPDTFYRVTWRLKENDCRETKDFDDLSLAWAAYRELITPEKAEEYSFINLVGYSLTGRAETHMVTTNFEV